MHKYVPKEITENVNVTPTHPLVNLASLLAIVMLAEAIIVAGIGLIAVLIVLLVNHIGLENEETTGAALPSSLPLTSDPLGSRI